MNELSDESLFNKTHRSEDMARCTHDKPLLIQFFSSLMLNMRLKGSGFANRAFVKAVQSIACPSH